MMHKKTIASLLAVMVLPATQVYAEDTIALKKANKSNTNQKAETAASVELESVVVLGKKEQVMTTDKGLAGSVDVITREELEYEHVTDTLELFSKTPGVVLSRYNQGIINTDLSIRGFSGDGETPHAKLLVDGIPSNLFNGYNEMDYLFPTNIQSIQVFKGTSDATTGLFATAGNYKVETRKDLGKQLQVGYGSFNTRELQGYFGDKHENFTQNYALGYRAGNGFRDHTDLEKIALSGRWQLDFEKSTLALSTKYGKYNAFEAPGYLSKTQARDNPRSSAINAQNDGGEKEFKHVSLHYDYFFNQDLDISFKTYWQDFSRQRTVGFVGAALEFRDEDQTSTGAIAKLNWRFDPKWSLETGYDIEMQDVTEFRIRPSQNRVRRNADYDFTAQGAYAKIENKPMDWLTWNFALRADRLKGSANGAFTVPNNLVVTTTLLKPETIIQPKFNIFANLDENHTLFANAGRSFQTPTGVDLNTQGGTVKVDIGINDGWELGLKSAWNNQINTRISYWEQVAQNEFVPVDGTRQLIGETKRQGVDTSIDMTLSDMWSIWANLSMVNQKITQGPDNKRALDGNRIRGIPDHTASLGLQFTPNSQWIARVHVDRQGAYYVNENNIGGKYGAYTLTNANVDYKTNWGRVSILANNLFDEYYEYVYDFSSNATNLNFSPGAGRNVMVTATLDF